MKIAVCSDIHGSMSAAYAFLNRADALGADKILLLGDLYYHGARNPLPEGYDPRAVAELLNQNTDRIIAVRGNCDSDVDLTVSAFEMAKEAWLFVGDKTVFATHGDKYDIDHLPKGKTDVLLYGHYHTGFIREKDGVLVANPGSPSLPKEGTPPSFLFIEENAVRLYRITGELIAEHAL